MFKGQLDQCRILWCVRWPLHFPQPIHRISAKCGPRRHHVRRYIILLRSVGYPCDVLSNTKDHSKVRSMVSATVVVQAQVLPVPEIAIPPGRHFSVDTCLRSVRVGAGEPFQIPYIPLLLCQVLLLSIGCELVETGFVICVSRQEGLLSC